MPDGRWGWLAARASESQVVARSGRWSVEGHVIALEVQEEREFVDCECKVKKTRSTRLDPPRAERLEFAECPDNEEARSVDTNYACRYLGGRAFWRRSPHDEADATAYFP